MRLTGIHDISKKWPKAARNRAIADLANHAKRNVRKDDFAWEIFDRIDKLATQDAVWCERDREYLIKGSRYAEEDAQSAAKTREANKNAENQAERAGKSDPAAYLRPDTLSLKTIAKGVELVKQIPRYTMVVWETGRPSNLVNIQSIPRPLPKGAKRYSGEYPTGGDSYFSMSVVKTNKEAAVSYFKKTYPWMEKKVLRKCLFMSLIS